MWCRALALRLRSPEGLRYYTDVKSALRTQGERLTSRNRNSAIMVEPYSTRGRALKFVSALSPQPSALSPQPSALTELLSAESAPRDTGRGLQRPKLARRRSCPRRPSDAVASLYASQRH